MDVVCSVNNKVLMIRRIADLDRWRWDNHVICQIESLATSYGEIGATTQEPLEQKQTPRTFLIVPILAKRALRC
jgi:hypothetical protein